MEYDVISDLITKIGYPIVMSLLLFYQNNKNAELHKQEMDKNNELHKQEMDRVIEVINRLEIAITELKNKIGG